MTILENAEIDKQKKKKKKETTPSRTVIMTIIANSPYRHFNEHNV